MGCGLLIQRSAAKTGFPGADTASFPRVRELIVSLPLWAIVAALLVFFWAVTIAAREFVLRRRDVEAREALADQANSLLTGVAATFANLSSASAGVAAVASRSLPRPLAALLIIVGVLTSILMGITTVIYRRPSLIFVWCLIPAVSITTVLALAYPFALRSGANLEPMRAVVQYLAVP